MTRKQQTTTDEEYRQKLSEVENLATNYAKSGIGYTPMRTAFNELCEKFGVNKAIDSNLEQIRLGRRIVAERISLDTLANMSVEVNRRLSGELIDIANDDAPDVNHHRHMRR